MREINLIDHPWFDTGVKGSYLAGEIGTYNILSNSR